MKPMKETASAVRPRSFRYRMPQPLKHKRYTAAMTLCIAAQARLRNTEKRCFCFARMEGWDREHGGRMMQPPNFMRSAITSTG